MPKELNKLEKIIKVVFNRKELLEEAIVHRSYINEHANFHLGHNERLEFLGDAVLELIVTRHLYLNYPNPEGELTNWRAALVNSKMLSETAEEMGLYDYLYLSKGEAKDSNPKARGYILANAMEALIGAIYLDQGFEVASKFITKNLLSKLPRIIEKKLYVDPKSNFQELSQEKVGITPSYQVLEESGPDHNKKFVIGIYLEDELIAKGVGTSKQEAQMDAAENALKARYF
ncbi:ribonuclease III [Candidatus Kuenenbacteria bacterium CG08_land_8_20_14_0_20_37_23]|uniref:Ribonuclease 3 n=2 Tax=Candidatus Kueneniibacteriota TaxID=1752740 RepID=A0A2M6XS27_9BACT|nr:MAG: ribonuclease III [Candidatus Kuenenbacteria bacterium CG1_02_38_13]PIU10438.1 MAG: ribonuclease III [Candidatus Kuenenbacteria bacterium CG08_land_8_20_14_0_20_37_23]